MEKKRELEKGRERKMGERKRNMERKKKSREYKNAMPNIVLSLSRDDYQEKKPTR